MAKIVLLYIAYQWGASCYHGVEARRVLAIIVLATQVGIALARLVNLTEAFRLSRYVGLPLMDPTDKKPADRAGSLIGKLDWVAASPL
jgi:hypothetical protein